MNIVKDSWEDEGGEDETTLVVSITEKMKLEARKKEEEADHELTIDLFSLCKLKPITKTTTIKQQPKQPLYVSRKEDNERKIKQKVAVKKQMIAEKRKHNEVFGDAELDQLQDEYCDYEDKY
jgi:hypothetical protein